MHATKDPTPPDQSETAVDILTRRATSAEEFFPDDPDHLDRALHAYWQRIAHRTAPPGADSTGEEPRSVREQLVAEWARAWAEPTSELSIPDLADNMDFQLMTPLGTDGKSFRANLPRTTETITAADESTSESR